jgi:hypothetical protein
MIIRSALLKMGIRVSDLKDICKTRNGKTKKEFISRCEVCGNSFISKSSRAKYCADHATESSRRALRGTQYPRSQKANMALYAMIDRENQREAAMTTRLNWG